MRPTKSSRPKATKVTHPPTPPHVLTYPSLPLLQGPISPSSCLSVCGDPLGLSYSSAENLKSYFHFRKPESAFARVSMEKEGLVRAGDFLDSIDDDKPKGEGP